MLRGRMYGVLFRRKNLAIIGYITYNIYYHVIIYRYIKIPLRLILLSDNNVQYVAQWLLTDYRNPSLPVMHKLLYVHHVYGVLPYLHLIGSYIIDGA